MTAGCTAWHDSLPCRAYRRRSTRGPAKGTRGQLEPKWQRRGGGPSFWANHDAKVFGGGNNGEIGPFRDDLLDDFRDPFRPIGGRVDPKGDEGALCYFEVKTRDVLEKVKVGLEGAEVLNRLRDRSDIVSKGSVSRVWE